MENRFEKQNSAYVWNKENKNGKIKCKYGDGKEIKCVEEEQPD